MSAFVPEAQVEIQAYCKTLARHVAEMLKKEENRKEFDAWYLKKYGKRYIWRTL